MAVKRSRIVVVPIVAVVIVYAVAIGNIFLDRHLEVPEGDYPYVLTGEYQVVDRPRLQIPEVFDAERVAIRDAGDDGMRIIDETGRTLLLTEGADGWYFSQSFDPTGASILPGIARNWNEGRISESGDRLLIEGYMLEKGLMLFVFPFKDVRQWQTELRKAAEPE